MFQIIRSIGDSDADSIQHTFTFQQTTYFYEFNKQYTFMNSNNNTL